MSLLRGQNTTGWQAVRLADTAPQEWTVVTRDLWKDFGDLTLTGIAHGLRRRRPARPDRCSPSGPSSRTVNRYGRLTTSPLAIEPNACQMTTPISSAMNCTEPSHMATCTPPA